LDFILKELSQLGDKRPFARTSSAIDLKGVTGCWLKPSNGVPRMAEERKRVEKS
jgi:hypothetical protein